jgi:hypothetical protein
MGETLVNRWEKFVQLAYDWHGGGGSAFYRFASNKGIVYGPIHAQQLCDEVNHILERSLTMNEREVGQLASFLIELRKYKAEVEDNGTILKGRDQYRTESNRATS